MQNKIQAVGCLVVLWLSTVIATRSVTYGTFNVRCSFHNHTEVTFATSNKARYGVILTDTNPNYVKNFTVQAQYSVVTYMKQLMLITAEFSIYDQERAHVVFSNESHAFVRTFNLSNNEQEELEVFGIASLTTQRVSLRQNWSGYRFRLHYKSATNSMQLDDLSVEERSDFGNNIIHVPTNSSLCTQYLQLKQNAQSISISQLSISSVNLVITLIVALLVFLFRNSVFIKNRSVSIIPCLIVLFLFDAMYVVVEPIRISRAYRYSVYTIGYSAANRGSGSVRVWCITVASLCFILNSVRYFHLRNLYYFMSTGTKVNLSVHRAVSSKLSYSLIIAFVAILVAILQILLGIFTTTHTAQNVLTVAACSVAGLFGIISVLLDFILQIRVMRKHGLKSYFANDALRFRIEMLLVFPTIIFGLLYIVTIEVNPQTTTRVRAVVGLNASSFFVFSVLVRLLLCGGFMCLFAAWELLRKQDTIESSGIDLEKLLHDPDCYQMMHDQSKAEFSLENLLFWKHFHELKDSANMVPVEKLETTFDKYMKPQSAYQVNLPNSSLKQYLQIIDNAKQQNQTKVEFNTVKDVVLVQVLANLSDTYARLRATERYKLWHNSKEEYLKQFSQ